MFHMDIEMVGFRQIREAQHCGLDAGAYVAGSEAEALLGPERCEALRRFWRLQRRLRSSRGRIEAAQRRGHRAASRWPGNPNRPEGESIA